ncbi:30S ribosomal protein S7 [Nanoarchaeota archaeon]|nr:MAG: 30S ribosomal protein S7 [Nanoarchaeota archaeon]
MSVEPKLFGKYDYNVTVRDPGLVRYISLRPVFLPHTHGRLRQRFKKSEANIVERFMKHLGNPGHSGKDHWWSSARTTGKYATHYKIMREAFEIIEKKTGENPIQVLVRAIENAAPREEVTTLGLGGVVVLKQVDTSPQRRVDLAIRWIVQGAYKKTTHSKKSAGEILAEEIMLAANYDSNAFAIKKKQEVERQAASSR